MREKKDGWMDGGFFKHGYACMMESDRWRIARKRKELFFTCGGGFIIDLMFLYLVMMMMGGGFFIALSTLDQRV